MLPARHGWGINAVIANRRVTGGVWDADAEAGNPGRRYAPVAMGRVGSVIQLDQEPT
jgi:hypothetical protein